MSQKNPNYSKWAFTIIIVSALMRTILAFLPGLSANEAYFRSLVLFPQLESLHSPPMMGWLIQLFTNNLMLDTPFFIRIAAIVCGTVSMWVLYLTAKKISGVRAGFFSVILFTASPYLSFGTGTAAVADAPATLFLLTAIYFFAEAFNPKRVDCSEFDHLCNMAMVLAGVFTGLSILSKFSMIMIWPGVFTYLLLYKREFFRKPSLYLSSVLSLFFLLPFYLWNPYNNFIINEIGLFSLNISGTITGTLLIIVFILLINNPFNIVIISKGLSTNKDMTEPALQTIRMSVILTISLTLYHLVTSERSSDIALSGFIASESLTPLIIAGGLYSSVLPSLKPIKRAVCFFSVSVILVVFQFYTGFAALNFLKKNDMYTPGKYDLTLRFYGGDEIKKAFFRLHESDVRNGLMPVTSYVIESDFYRASRLEYYIGSKDNTAIKTIEKNSIKSGNYQWITERRGSLKVGDSAYYICVSTNENSKFINFASAHFEKVERAKVLYINRGGIPALRVTFYRLIHLNRIP